MAAATATMRMLDSAPPYTPHIHGRFPMNGDAQTREAPPPYPTSLPDTFPIGHKRVSPVVTVFELQDHLRILGSFAKLRDSVKATVSGDKDNANAAWAIFLSRAVHRFHRWVINVRPSVNGALPRESIPPIDVLMVWHSYLLVSFLCSSWAHMRGNRLVSCTRTESSFLL
jgi:hypothetical protein